NMQVRRGIMHFVDEAEVSRVLTFPILIEALEAAHRRPKIDVLDGYLGNEKQQYVIRSAADHGRYLRRKCSPASPLISLKGKSLRYKLSVFCSMDPTDVRWQLWAAQRLHIGGRPPTPLWAPNSSHHQILRFCFAWERAIWRIF